MAASTIDVVEELTGSSPIEVAIEERQHAIVDYLLDKQDDMQQQQQQQNEQSRMKFSIQTILVSITNPSSDIHLLKYLADVGHYLVIDDLVVLLLLLLYAFLHPHVMQSMMMMTQVLLWCLCLCSWLLLLLLLFGEYVRSYLNPSFHFHQQ